MRTRALRHVDDPDHIFFALDLREPFSGFRIYARMTLLEWERALGVKQ